MKAVLILKAVSRFLLSLCLSFLGLLACPAAASVGVPQVMSVWFFPAKFIVPLISLTIPATWIYGSPNDENYWPQVSAGGFAILCTLFFWALVLFISFELWRHFRQSGMPNPSIKRDALKRAPYVKR